MEPIYIGSRPRLTPDLAADEFRRWYWLKRELQEFARLLGVSSAGGKQQIADRIAARLSDDPIPAQIRRGRAGPQLAGVLTLETVVPDGQRLTAHLRAFMARECGPGFRFDRSMRAFFADPRGRTLSDAVACWRESRDDPPAEIEPQFEYNAFARAWRLAHPGGSHAEMVAGWAAHKAKPADCRD
jgi:hypothetical protein